MLPPELYKRRHYGTPQSILLLIANFTVFTVSVSLFASGKTVNSFFWVAMGLLAIYNFFNIRKDREEYNRFRIIAYVLSIVIMIALFFIFRAKAY
ncbi:hypothetical protein [Mucilaginibacter sp. L196]|uniref:hypothetical protein n=1 Tax=Mucilaginibacter sp. L196 TaxID=1641870 RepID=UPI00131AB340|nr:hypothetical protein [Mucilaginibacter sp. L196]